MHSRCNPMSARYFRRKSKAASERGRRWANARWKKDRERRERLADQERDRMRHLVVILRDNRTGEERVSPYDRLFAIRVKNWAESEW